MFKKNNPGCPCCCPICRIESLFADATWVAKSGTWTQQGTDNIYWTADNNAIFERSTAFHDKLMRFTVVASLPTGDVLRIGFANSDGDRIWGEFSWSVNGLTNEGTLKLVEQESGGSETTLVAAFTEEMRRYSGNASVPVTCCFDPEYKRFFFVAGDRHEGLYASAVTNQNYNRDYDRPFVGTKTVTDEVAFGGYIGNYSGAPPRAFLLPQTGHRGFHLSTCWGSGLFERLELGPKQVQISVQDVTHDPTTGNYSTDRNSEQYWQNFNGTFTCDPVAHDGNILRGFWSFNDQYQYLDSEDNLEYFAEHSVRIGAAYGGAFGNNTNVSIAIDSFEPPNTTVGALAGRIHHQIWSRTFPGCLDFRDTAKFTNLEFDSSQRTTSLPFGILDHIALPNFSAARLFLTVLP